MYCSDAAAVVTENVNVNCLDICLIIIDTIIAWRYPLIEKAACSTLQLAYNMAHYGGQNFTDNKVMSYSCSLIGRAEASPIQMMLC